MFFSIFFLIQPVLPGMAGRNRIQSMEISSSLELVLYQLWLMDITLHTCLLMEVMQKNLFKCQMNVITLLEVFGESFLSPWPSAKMLMIANLHHPSPQPDFLMMACSCHLPLKLIFSWYDGHIIQIISINTKALISCTNESYCLTQVQQENMTKSSRYLSYLQCTVHAW